MNRKDTSAFFNRGYAHFGKHEYKLEYEAAHQPSARLWTRRRRARSEQQATISRGPFLHARAFRRLGK